MPTIRDGRGVLTVHDMSTPPAGSSLGPVERRQVSEARMADFAAERAGAAEHDRQQVSLADKAKAAREHLAASRARGAKAGGFVTGATKPHQVKPAEEKPMVGGEHHDIGRIREQVADGAAAAAGWSGAWSEERRAKAAADRAARTARILDAIRTAGSYTEAAVLVGISRHALEVDVSALRKRGELPADVAELLRRRNPSIRKPTSPAEPATIEVQAPEASVPATDADELGPTATGPAAEQVATPPAPTPLDGVSLQLTLDVTAAEMATWRPERIALFFRGIATVTMARWAVEP